MSNTANVTMRLDVDLIKRIDRAARQAGQNRTEYVVSWLPVAYDSKADQATDEEQQPQR